MSKETPSTWTVSEPVHVDLGMGDRRVERDFPAGPVDKPDKEDLIVLEHLRDRGLAACEAAAEKPAKKIAQDADPAPAKEDDHATRQ